MSFDQHCSHLREQLGLAISFVPTPKETALFEADMLLLHPHLLDDAIKEAIATKLGAETPKQAQRAIIHTIYNRKVKELAALYPFLFTTENALRVGVHRQLATIFHGEKWWTFVRDAVAAGKRHTDFQNIKGVEVPVEFKKRVFNIFRKLHDGPHSAKLHSQAATFEIFYLMTLGDIGDLICHSFDFMKDMFCPPMHPFKLDTTTFTENFKTIRDARNNLFHCNPVRNRKQVFNCCELLLSSLRIHLGDLDQRLSEITYVRSQPNIDRLDTHFVPPLVTSCDARR